MLAKEKNIELILVKTPCQMTEEIQAKINLLVEYAEENKISFIDYNRKFKELNIQEGDFYDVGHLSGAGSDKVSKSFALYLKNKER